ncbi:MAG: hypothetical protein K5640_08810 [Treponema sp.]|nr:hypothetical protein [Treponema sp.]
MKVRLENFKVIDKIIVNWPAKVICVLIALLLYFFYNLSRLDSKTISVPLDIKSDGQFMAVSSFQKHVRVNLRASPESLAQISTRDIEAVLDINNYTHSGVFDVPVSLSFSPDFYLIDPIEVHVTPDRIKLQIEDKTFSYKNIQVSFADSLPDGYEMVSYTVNPSSLKVTGARSAVEQTTVLFTNRLPLSGHTRTFSAPVQISSLNSLISIENNAEVIVTVEIQPQRTHRDFTNIPVNFNSLNSNLKVSDDVFFTRGISFTLLGEKITLDKLSDESVSVSADCQEIEHAGEYELKLQYSIPDKTKLYEPYPETVTVKIEAADASDLESDS